MQHVLPKLPYPIDALEPHISQETIEFHYGKHHSAYVKKLNELIKKTQFENMTLGEIILKSSGEIFNNAAQTWNHNFYWRCLTPESPGQPKRRFADVMTTKFGSFDQFKETFKKSAVGNFGSGWTWLVKNRDGSLAIKNTGNAENPLLFEQTPLLTCDVWEHAYYIDYRNERAKYVDTFWNIVNWEFVEENFTSADTLVPAIG
jgi:Fe-Mn family superoxide dismutase